MDEASLVGRARLAHGIASDRMSISSALRPVSEVPKCDSSWLFIILNVNPDTSSDPAMSCFTCAEMDDRNRVG